MQTVWLKRLQNEHIDLKNQGCLQIDKSHTLYTWHVNIPGLFDENPALLFALLGKTLEWKMIGEDGAEYVGNGIVDDANHIKGTGPLYKNGQMA